MAREIKEDIQANHSNVSGHVGSNHAGRDQYFDQRKYYMFPSGDLKQIIPLASLKYFEDSLRLHYQQYNSITRLFRDESLPISESYIHLQLFQDDGSSDQSISFESIYTNKPVPHSRQRTIIMGNAGMGKTTLLKRIVYEWADEYKKLWQGYFSYVFWIPLRELRNLPEQRGTLEVLLQQLYFKDEPKILHTIGSILEQYRASGSVAKLRSRN